MKTPRNWPLWSAKEQTAATSPTAKVMSESYWIVCDHEQTVRHSLRCAETAELVQLCLPCQTMLVICSKFSPFHAAPCAFRLALYSSTPRQS